MNTEAKRAISDRFKAACEREGLNYSEAARLLGLKNSVYGPHISNEKSFNKASSEAWETVKAWTNSGLTLRQYGAKLHNDRVFNRVLDDEKPKKETVPERPDQKPDDPIDHGPLIDLKRNKIEFQEIEETELVLIPYCCPVCGGNGLVPNGFYNQVGGMWSSTDATPEKCRACNGTGIVWG